MSYLLLTGATGLVGRYLLRDLMEMDVPVAALARPNRVESASDRIESVMARFEGLAGRSLPRPVVIQASLTEPGLGMADRDRAWMAANCDTILHCAASMTFRRDKHGEPFRTNVDGMRQVIEFARQAGIRKFHHVSTAYICGLREGRIYENEVDLGQQNGNVYEVSKLSAEKMLREADFIDELTVYRPASVVGDSRDGFTTSSHGFYHPLQLAYVIADKVPTEMMGERFFRLLGLRGDEGKNLVPVDWLASAIIKLAMSPEHHRQTYHMTNPRPVTVRDIQGVVREAIELYSPRRFTGTLSESEIVGYERLFRQHMDIYRSHWRDDPLFDRTNIERALPQLPCPEIDHDMLLRIAAYPVQHNFVLNKIEPIAREINLQERFDQMAATGQGGGNGNGSAETVGVSVSGSGGGQWRLAIRDGQVVGVDHGLGPADRARFYLNSNTLSSLIKGQCSVEQSLRTGGVMIERDAAEGSDLDCVGLLKRIVSSG